MDHSSSPADFVARAAEPATVPSLLRDLESLGVTRGAIVLVHASLSSIGFVCGGAVAVIEALLRAVGDTGTLVMPAHTADLSEPSRWTNPPVPEDWWPTIREQTPAFDPGLTPTRRMGIIAETFRRWPGACRSSHPSGSFAAIGSRARFVTEAHSLEFPFGESSPLARLYELDGHVLLLGVGHERNTSLHLAEVRARIRPEILEGAPVTAPEGRVWVRYRDIEYDSTSFGAAGEAYEAAHPVRMRAVGAATTRYLRQRPLVDFAVEWFRSQSPGAAR